MPLPYPIAEVNDPVRLGWLLGVQDFVSSANDHRLMNSTQVFTVPDGVFKVKVFMCGGGGRHRYQGDTGLGSGWTGPVRGGTSPMCVKTLAVTPGQSIGVTIGAAAANSNNAQGGTSSFGSFFSVTGGRTGTITSAGAHGAGSGHDYTVSNFLIYDSTGLPYGSGFHQDFVYEGPAIYSGGPGVCYVTW